MKLAKAIQKAKHVYLIGNGGSYANAAHIANDLLALGIKAFTLDAATLTASANDFGYATVFARWIATVGETGDLLLALSGSGKSANIVAALQAAKEKGIATWAIMGDFGARQGPCFALADNSSTWGKTMQEAEEKQLYIGHKVMQWLKSSSY